MTTQLNTARSRLIRPKPTAWSNAANGLIKEGTTKCHIYPNRFQMEHDLHRWFVFYNFERIHRQIGRMTPHQSVCNWHQKQPELFRPRSDRVARSPLTSSWDLTRISLDPKLNARPVDLGDMNINQFGAQRDEEDKGAFTLVGDIEPIVSVDAQYVILVTGVSKADMRRLNELIDVLDQPLL